jgi:hypothetical protein
MTRRQPAIINSQVLIPTLFQGKDNILSFPLSESFLFYVEFFFCHFFVIPESRRSGILE